MDLPSVLILISIFLLSSPTLTDQKTWEELNTWYNQYPECRTVAQSPVDIIDEEAVVVPTLNLVPFRFNKAYSRVPRRMVITNTGKDVTVTIPDRARRKLSGGGLDGIYLFHSLHYHFGENPWAGAEHLKDGHQFPNELHLVHYSARFSSIQEAAASKRRDALAVLGVWIDIGPGHEDFPDVFDEVTARDLKRVNKTVDITPFSLMDLLASEHLNDYYRYYGSLTMPKCNEVVVWTVFKEPCSVREETIQHMCKVMYDLGLQTKGSLCRPPQLLHGRVVMKTPDGDHMLVNEYASPWRRLY